MSPADVLAEVAAAAAEEPGVDEAVAGQAVVDARAELAADQAAWPAVTDYERLQLVFDDLATGGIVVLQGVDDHWSAARELEDFMAHLPASPRVSGRLQSGGRPAQTILATAAVGDFDLIVMGTHGRTGLTRLLMGSVAERVVREAPCPVLTVSERDGTRSEADPVERV